MTDLWRTEGGALLGGGAGCTSGLLKGQGKTTRTLRGSRARAAGTWPPRSILPRVSVLEQVRADINTAVKASERERATALRMVLSELQKAAKEGGDDELAVLRRERKRRLEAAEQFREAGRVELADKEQSEAELITTYLPSELPDAEIDAIISDAIAQTGATEAKDMGQVMKIVMAAAGGRADGKRVSARVRDALSG
jgi:uncharacterized protein YqeY